MTASEPVLRQRPGWFGQLLMDFGLTALPFFFGILRKYKPIMRIGNTYLVTRHDDVRDVFAADNAFAAPYLEKLNVIMGGAPFILGMADGPDYRVGLAALRNVVRRSDLPMLAKRVEAKAEAIVAAAPGRIDVVDTLVRNVTFDYIAEYLGVAAPAGADLRVWGTRLFEFQFVSDDAPLRAEVARIAPALRDHVQREIDRCRSAPNGRYDVIARSLVQQASGTPGFTDDWIRTNVVGLLVGGPPQPPMVVPQAMEQLLRRPEALASAQAAARTNDDAALAAHIAEAMRFDPLAPWLPRTAVLTHTIGCDKLTREIPAGSKVLASIASAMRDERFVPEPQRFDAGRTPDQYIHFGYGVHQCFGMWMNQATLHLMLKPLLKRSGLRRSAGRDGKLRKRGAFASALMVEFDV
jgi:cytochrome P450